MDLNDVKAGKYQLVARRWDKITSKPGEPLDYVRYRRGDVVDLNAEDAKRLVGAGAVVKPGQLEKSAAEEARAVAERAQREYEAILAGLPEDARPGDSTTEESPAQKSGKEPTVKQVLADVGDDPEKARAALEAEQAKGEDARSSLVEKLQAVVAGD